MKKLLSTVLALVFILSFAMIPAEAKILHQCHVCYGTGTYKCDASDCVNGIIGCGRCNGSGTIEEGKTCPDCGGKGKREHDSEWCRYAVAHGGQCPVCKGTGYEGDSVEGTPNNGSSNRPQPGDGIYNLDGSYYVYGGGSSGGNSGGDNGGSSSSDTTAATTKADDTPAPVLDPDIGKTDVKYDPVELPDNRQATMYLGTPAIENDDFAGTTATGSVKYQDMSDSQKAVYDSIPDEDLAQILGNVQGIISTVKVGEAAAESQKSVDAFLSANNIKDFKDANILPISFDGHIEIGFPVQVSVEVGEDTFDGSKPIHVFHIKEDGSIIQIPDENVTWIARDDGKISRVEFYTDSFSDFLLSDAEGLVAPETLDIETPDEPVITPGATEKSHSALKIVTIVIVALIAIGALVFFILKNRKTPDPIDEIKDPIDEIPEPETEENKDE